MEKTDAKIGVVSLSLGSILLIAGTCIGGGMLALPIVTAPMGMIFSSLLFFLTWLTMTSTAFLMVEASLNMPGSNLLGVSRQILGPLGEIVSGTSYLLLLYSLMAAYISGVTSLISPFASVQGGNSPWISLFLTGVICLFLLCGIKMVDYLNRSLLLCTALCYLFLVSLLYRHLHTDTFTFISNTSMLSSLPVLVTSFGFHIIIPSLTKYLKANRRIIHTCIWIGSAIPLLFYLGWQLAILGALPIQGEGGIFSILQSQDQLGSLIISIEKTTQSSFSSKAASLFCIFAIFTSLLGVALSLWDFLEEGLSFLKVFSKKRYLSMATFVPPLLLVIFLPSIFSSLLSYAGIFVAILLGIIPISLVHVGRKSPTWVSHNSRLTKKSNMVILALFFLLVIAAEGLQGL